MFIFFPRLGQVGEIISLSKLSAPFSLPPPGGTCVHWWCWVQGACAPALRYLSRACSAGHAVAPAPEGTAAGAPSSLHWAPRWPRLWQASGFSVQQELLGSLCSSLAQAEVPMQKTPRVPGLCQPREWMAQLKCFLPFPNGRSQVWCSPEMLQFLN